MEKLRKTNFFSICNLYDKIELDDNSYSCYYFFCSKHDEIMLFRHASKFVLTTNDTNTIL